jgi:pyrophosphatase PpaX
VADVLAHLRAKGHPMALVTSKYHGLATRVLRHVDFAKHFDVVIGGDSIENPKPHPQPVLRALSDLRHPASDAVFVGDSPHDMHSGNAAGVATAAALWGPFTRDQLAESQPSHWLDGIEGLPALCR